VDHVAGCAQTEKAPCPAGVSLHGEPITEHWWSGWPGAFCLKCGSEDKDEVCIGGGCACPCHADFWAEYERAVAKGGVG
jgi:hypothetical protein